MNRVLKYLKKHNIGKKLLSLLLCLLTVVCFGGVLAPAQAHAVTGVEEIITFVIGISPRIAIARIRCRYSSQIGYAVREFL